MFTQTTDATLLMYRYRRDSLEVFLVQPEAQNNWSIPQRKALASNEIVQSFGGWDVRRTSQEIIPIEVKHEGQMLRALAFEADWDKEAERLPFAGILGDRFTPFQIRRRLLLVKREGAFFVLKEALKKVFPGQVALLRELQEIVTTRNAITYL